MIHIILQFHHFLVAKIRNIKPALLLFLINDVPVYRSCSLLLHDKELSWESGDWMMNKKIYWQPLRKIRSWSKESSQLDCASCRLQHSSASTATTASSPNQQQHSQCAPTRWGVMGCPEGHSWALSIKALLPLFSWQPSLIIEAS